MPSAPTALRISGRFTPDVRFATDDYVVAQRLVAAGLGVALLPAWALAAAAQVGVQAIPLRGVDDRIVEVLVRPDTRRIPGVAAVLADLRAWATRESALGLDEGARPAAERGQPVEM